MQPVAAGPGLEVRTSELGMEAYMQQVVRFNETVQARLLGFHAARRQRMAEMGNFEPALVGSAEWVDRQQPNTDPDARLQNWVQNIINGNRDQDFYPDIYEENTWRYSSAVEVRTPLGTRIQLGLFGDDIFRNAPITSDNPQEGYQTRLGLTIEQPLLKGLGYAANLASLRMAARQSEIAFQDYRREMMGVVAEAELAYWELYYAQEELKLTRESVALAETLLADSQASLDAGRGSRLDVLEAEAGLALRRSREREAYQKRVNALNQLASFFGVVPRESRLAYEVTDAPESMPVETHYEIGLRSALAMNPDVVKARIQVEQERIRLGYAKNQRLPELNLKADIGTSGFGDEWNESFNDMEKYDFPLWSVGVVVRLPLWGDVRGRNEQRAAKLRLMQAERNESSLITQVRVGRDTAEQRVASNFTTARSMQSVVEFRTSLLDTRMQSRDIGRMDTRSVLEAEQELFAARLDQLQSEIDYQRALLELQLISGTILQMRDLELTYDQLVERSSYWVRSPDRQAPGLTYRLPRLERLAGEEPVEFESEKVSTPWLGVNWSELPMRSYDEPYTIEKEHDAPSEPDQNRPPRRIGGSHNR